MELNLQRRVTGLKDKLPDIQKTLDTVGFLQTRRDEPEPIETTFELNETLYAKAEVPATDEVYLWLGVGSPSLHLFVPKVPCWLLMGLSRQISCWHIPSMRPRNC